MVRTFNWLEPGFVSLPIWIDIASVSIYAQGTESVDEGSKAAAKIENFCLSRIGLRKVVDRVADQ